MLSESPTVIQSKDANISNEKTPESEEETPQVTVLTVLTDENSTPRKTFNLADSENSSTIVTAEKNEVANWMTLVEKDLSSILQFQTTWGRV